jgi:hypothetical protein
MDISGCEKIISSSARGSRCKNQNSNINISINETIGKVIEKFVNLLKIHLTW